MNRWVLALDLSCFTQAVAWLADDQYQLALELPRALPASPQHGAPCAAKVL